MSARCAFLENQRWSDRHPQLRAAWQEWLIRHGIDPAVAPDVDLIWSDDDGRRVYVSRAVPDASRGTWQEIAAVQLEAPALPIPLEHEVITSCDSDGHGGWGIGLGQE